MNLLQETIKALELYDKTMDDVIHIFIRGCGGFQITKEDFIKVADREYDDGYGATEVNQHLTIECEEFYLQRKEYDGSEWWVRQLKQWNVPQQFGNPKEIFNYWKDQEDEEV